MMELKCCLQLLIVYEEFCKIEELFDLSNYLKDSKCYNKANNLVVKIKHVACLKRFCRIKM